MEFGHWLMLSGLSGVIGGFIYMITDKSYGLLKTPVSVMVMILGGLVLVTGAIIQNSADMTIKQKQCLQSGGEWLGKRKYSVATKTYLTYYDCYTLKEKS